MIKSIFVQVVPFFIKKKTVIYSPISHNNPLNMKCENTPEMTYRHNIILWSVA
nr:MAG TPA: hypothetical protein [Caudoviricetes sp.]